MTGARGLDPFRSARRRGAGPGLQCAGRQRICALSFLKAGAAGAGAVGAGF